MSDTSLPQPSSEPANGETARSSQSPQTYGQRTAVRRLATLSGHSEEVRHLAWGRLNGSTVLATASYDLTARIWDPVTGECLVVLAGGHDENHSPLHIAWGQIGDRPAVTTAARHGLVRVWDAETGRRLSSVSMGPRGHVRHVAWGSMNGLPVIATACTDDTAGIWDAASGNRIAMCREVSLGGFRSNVAWGVLDARPVLAAGNGIWDPSNGRRVATLSGASQVTRVLWGELGGRPVVVAGGPLGIWDAATGEQLVSFEGPTIRVEDC